MLARSLRARFALGLGAMLLPFLLAAAVGQFYLLPRLTGPFEEMAKDMVEELEPVMHIQITLPMAGMPANDYLIDSDPAERGQFAQSSREVDEAFEVALAAPSGLVQERVLVESAHTEWQQARLLAEAILRLQNPAGNPVGARDMKQMDAHIDRAVKLLDQVHHLVRQEIDEALAAARTARQWVVFLTLSAFAAAGGIFLFAALQLARPLLAGLGALGSTAARLAAGDISARAALDRQDELGQLALAFNAMADELEKRALQLSTLNQIAVAITSSLNSRNLLDEIMRRGIALTGAKASCIAFYDEATGCCKEWITHGFSEHFVKNMAFQPGGLADEAFTTASYILSNDRPETGHKLSRLAREEYLRCFICLPLTSRDRRLGVIYFYRADRDTFTPTEIELLTTFASLAAQAIENARLYAQVQEQARTDALTGLYNRRAFDALLADELVRAQRFKRPVSLLLLDIDHFKRVNDTHGHLAGDAVLKGLSELLGRQARAIDRVCRYGGEEITVILLETDLEIAANVAERLRATVEAQLFDVNAGAPLRITVSIGVASFSVHADNAQALVAAADAALYAAKQGGRNRISLYEPALGQPS